MGRLRYHDVAFEDGFLSAVRDDGSVLNFTRRERALLIALTARPRRLLLRRQLHEALGGEGGDRSVDFVVNKLRAKLGDSGRDQRFISTQYGEGYVWVAPAGQADQPDEPFIVIRGGACACKPLLEGLRAELQGRAAPRRRVVVLADVRPGDRSASGARFAVEVVSEGRKTAAALLEEPSRHAILTLRLPSNDPSDAALAAAAEAMTDAMWTHLALGREGPPGLTDVPIALRLHDAVTAFGAGEWSAEAAQVAPARPCRPQDAASALGAAYRIIASVYRAPGPEPLSALRLAPLEAEVERLVLGVLPELRRDPMLAIGAADALFFTHRGHMQLAEDLVREALAQSVALAAASPMLGRLAAWRGELDEAVAFYDRALGLAEPGTEFEAYLLSFKGAALMAADDRRGVAEVFARMNAVKPSTREALGGVFIPPLGREAPADLARRMAAADLGAARRLVAYQHFVVARGFSRADHAANVMRGPLSHLLPRFGPAILPLEPAD